MVSRQTRGMFPIGALAALLLGSLGAVVKKNDFGTKYRADGENMYRENVLLRQKMDINVRHYLSEDLFEQDTTGKIEKTCRQMLQ